MNKYFNSITTDLIAKINIQLDIFNSDLIEYKKAKKDKEIILEDLMDSADLLQQLLTKYTFIYDKILDIISNPMTLLTQKIEYDKLILEYKQYKQTIENSCQQISLLTTNN